MSKDKDTTSFYGCHVKFMNVLNKDLHCIPIALEDTKAYTQEIIASWQSEKNPRKYDEMEMFLIDMLMETLLSEHRIPSLIQYKTWFPESLHDRFDAIKHEFSKHSKTSIMQLDFTEEMHNLLMKIRKPHESVSLIVVRIIESAIREEKTLQSLRKD